MPKLTTWMFAFVSVALSALLSALLCNCADVASSARARASAAVELGAAGRPEDGSAGSSSTGGAPAVEPPTELGGAAGLSAAGAAGASSTGGAAGSAGAPAVDPCASPVLLPGAALPAGPWRQDGRAWRVHGNPSHLATFPAPCAGAAIETDPVCAQWFPVLVEACP